VWLHDVESLGSQTEFGMFKRLRVNEAMEEKARRALRGSASKLSWKGSNKSRRQTTADGLQLQTDIDIDHVRNMIQMVHTTLL
jgi:hypothetical protein